MICPVKFRSLVLAFLLLFAASCTPITTGRHLSQIEHLLEHDPEGASLQLDSLDTSRLNRRNLALYAILKTQADYKLYRDIPTDSVIRIATDYYGTKRKDYHAAMAWYTLGCISGELNHDSTAADAYLNAMRMFPDTLVRYYALCEQNLSYIYLEHDLADEAIQMIGSCRINAERLKDSAAIAFCEFNTANYYLYHKHFQEAQNLFLGLIGNKWLSDDSKDIPLIQLSKISQHKDKDYKQSLEYIDSFIARNHNKVSYGTAYSVKADAFYGLNLVDSAQFYYELSLNDATDPRTICDSYRRLSEIQTQKGNKDSATYYIKQSSMWMDSTTIAYQPNDIYKTILNNSKKRVQSSQTVKIIVLPLILIIIVLVLIRER